MKYRRIVLIKPPEFYESSFNFGTFSLAVIASAVRDIADVTVIDATDTPIESLLESIRKINPDLIGLTAMGIRSVQPLIDLLKPIRRTFEIATIITGGHGSSMMPEPILNAGADCIVFGEGEATLRDIVQNGIQPGMEGTVTLNNGSICRGPVRPLINPLDSLNSPSRDLIPPPPNNIHLMETSRGCPHHCKFCETSFFYGNRWRPLSTQRVVDEVVNIIDNHDGWIIQIADDNFTASTNRVKEICRKLIDEEAYPAYFMFSARGDDLISDHELLPLMAEARFLRASVGIESLDPGVASSIDKIISPETYRNAFERMRELGIFSIASLIVGLPGETPEAIERNFNFLVEAGPDSAHFLPFLPQPGIPLSSQLETLEVNPVHIEKAFQLSEAYFNHPETQSRLKSLSTKETIQGMFAQATLRKRG